MGIIFQPRPPAGARATADVTGRPRLSRGRSAMFVGAIESVVIGDVSRFDEMFTDDVAFSAPHVMGSTLAELRAAVGQPEDALRDVVMEVHPLDLAADEVVAEWRLTAVFDRPLLFDDNVLIQPTGGTVQMSGATFATFRGSRICSFRNYFDDSQLLDEVPGVPAHLRWSARRRGPER